MRFARLQELRQEKKYTQKQLAELLNTSQSQISKYETDSASLSAPILKLYAELFDVSADYILGLSDIRKYKLSSHNSRLEDYIILFNQLDALDQNIIIAEMSKTIKHSSNKKTSTHTA